MEFCPFVYGRALQPAEFYGRKGEFRRLLGRLVTGQSTAIIGQPHTGKTSFLNYILDNASRRHIVGNRLDQSIFSYIDSQMLGHQFDQSAFWEHALLPLHVHFTTGTLYQMYNIAKENHFGTFTLEQLFHVLGQNGWQFVLLLDEFDTLLTHPMLNSTEFYGGLRSLASRCAGFTLILTSRRGLNVLNQKTQEMNPHGSPYFNVFTELRLGPLAPECADALLEQGKGHFGSLDRQFIMRVSGRHPYLLQSTAAVIWELHAQGQDGKKRYHTACNEVYCQTYSHYADTWNAWATAEKRAFTAIALSQIQGIVGDRAFSWKDLAVDLTDYESELRRLKDQGTIRQTETGAWEVMQEAFLWWLSDEIKRITRDKSSFEGWLCEQEMDGLFTKEESQKIGVVVEKLGGLLGKGAVTLITSLAKEFGK